MTTATRRKADKPYSTFSKGTQAVAKRIAPFAAHGTLTVLRLGSFTERVEATIGEQYIRVTVESGTLRAAYTCRVGLVPDSATDYFPGHYWESLAKAISFCLPDERATTRDLAVGNTTGYLSVTIYREGAGLKPVAYLDLHLSNHPTRYGAVKIKKVKAGQLLHLCQAFVAAEGQDIACTSSILDWLEENHEEAGRYLAEARNPPPRRPAGEWPVYTF